MNIAILLFNNFETLDAFGPAEVFGRLKDLYTLRFYSLNGGHISNHHGVTVLTDKLDDISDELEIFLIPGGMGTRVEVENTALLDKIREISDRSTNVLTVCTGSALLARTGLLDQRRATSNKRAFSWVITQGPNVKWDKNARWVIDGKYYTSSGVSAGIDMSLGFLADQYGLDFARRVAREMEYHWTEDMEDDAFGVQ